MAAAALRIDRRSRARGSELLGLSPSDAEHTLWLEGLKSRVAGHGREVVAQLPGRALTSANGVSPDLYSGAVSLTLGRTVTRPVLPALTPGEPAGVLAVRLVFSGGPPPPRGQQRLPSAGTVNVFSADGKLLAQPHTPAGAFLDLHLAPGTYLLDDEQASAVPCLASRAVVRAGHTTNVTVDSGCGVL